MVVRDRDHPGVAGRQVDAARVAAVQNEELRILDIDAFPRSKEFLRSCQDYAACSGCRFRSEDFRGICDDLLVSEASPKSKSSAGSPEREQKLGSPPKDDKESVALVGAARSKDSGPLLTAKLKAEPAIREFAKRLQSGDKGLEEEMDRALRIVLADGARNAMIATCQALELWPPAPPPAGVEDEDCAYQDVSAPLPVIAQRLYNDQVRRICDESGALQGLEVRARTASFLVDFTHAVGVPLPETTSMQSDMMKEFATRVSAWEKEQSCDSRSLSFSTKEDADSHSEVQKWWNDNRGNLLLGAAAGVLVAATAAVAAGSKKR